MRILIIVPSLTRPYLGPSVVARNTFNGFLKINKELEKNDIQLTFLSINDEIEEKIVNENIKIIGSRRHFAFYFPREIQASIKKMKDFDLAHSHDICELLPYMLLKTPAILTLHGVFWKEIKFKKGFFPKIWLNLGELRLKFYYPRLAKFIAISQYMIDELKSRGFDDSKAIIIENPISDEFFSVEKDEEPIILYPATLRPLKNQLGFLKAVFPIRNELRDYKIVFAGSGDKDYEAMLRDFGRKNDLNVEFLGKVPYDGMPKLYSKASIVALTSFQEILPMSILEALATGTPVLASNVGGIPYTINNGETGFSINPNDPKVIAEKLLILTNDSSLRKRMSEQARNEAEKRWKAEIIAKKLLDLYASLRT